MQGQAQTKNTEGYDRIPQRILIAGRESINEPLTNQFKLGYRDGIVLGQWLISKIIPVMVNTYRRYAHIFIYLKKSLRYSSQEGG